MHYYNYNFLAFKLIFITKGKFNNNYFFIISLTLKELIVTLPRWFREGLVEVYICNENKQKCW